MPKHSGGPLWHHVYAKTLMLFQLHVTTKDAAKKLY